MGKKRTAILWIRNDFRIKDNFALSQAEQYDEVLPVFIWNDKDKNPWKRGAASKWWLHHTILQFRESLKSYGSQLILLRGSPEEEILRVARLVQASDVLCNHTHHPHDLIADQTLQGLLEKEGICFQSFHGSLLCPVDELCKKDGEPYLVYTPFWKNFLKTYEIKILVRPKTVPPVPQKAKNSGCSVEDLNLLPRQKWHEAFHLHWSVGEAASEKKLKDFIAKGLMSYDKLRDFPATDGTSTLSPHLHFGEIHPQRVLYEIVKKFGKLSDIKNENVMQFCREILWREFSYHLLHHFPDTPDEPLRERFRNFPWKNNKKGLHAWCRGQTGYPVVDAGMRQLWSVGWMHNRVRMISASFLVKHLGIPWQEGAKWFWDTLVDADLANNTQGWQWTAGCGADAAPFFRIFNPITQGEKFDPDGSYIARWCPELGRLAPKWICRPWEAPVHILNEAGVRLGDNYPLPIVDHKEAREQALWNYESLKSQAGSPSGSCPGSS
ncbi:MAG: deoxyribodipyrimidine photo-lyase [Deltaproteobacteria bacterium]|nr:deoxyribodipyrimidine photo-lyase [Deltaproteobacteria bacterium]